MPKTGGKTYGFVQAGALVSAGVRGVAGKRGFAETRLLTHWREVVGADLAAIIQPVKVTYRQEGFGATLVVTCSGARAPEVAMSLETLRERVNACYGYNAIAHVRIDQSAKPSPGFAEAQAAFHPPAPSPDVVRKARDKVTGVESDALKEALQRLGQNILSRQHVSKKRQGTHNDFI